MIFPRQYFPRPTRESGIFKLADRLIYFLFPARWDNDKLLISASTSNLLYILLTRLLWDSHVVSKSKYSAHIINYFKRM